MNIFRESFKVYKEKFFTLAFAQLAMFFSSMFFLLFVKGKLADYLGKIKAFEPQLQNILTTLDATNPASIAESTTLVDSLNQITGHAVFFATIVVPIVLFLLWIIFQAIFWANVKKQKITSVKRYLLKLGIPSAVLFFFVFKFVVFPGDIVEFFNTFDSSMLKILVTSFITLYFISMYYVVLGNQSFHDAVKRTFGLSIKKFYKFIPLYLPLFINTIVIVWLLAVAITQKFVNSYAYVGLFPLIILVLVTLNISKYYKILFQKIVDRN